jgi:2,3-bisphosphoglycerate-dependent phosphoglycerate mutase
MVYERVMPFYTGVLLPLLNAGTTVLLVSHGNAIRALMKYIENVPDEKVRDIEMLFGAIVIYEIDKEGHSVSKEVRHVKSEVNA